MRIGIDLDGVLIDFFPAFLVFYNKKYKKNYSLKDITDFCIWKVGIGKDKKEAIEIITEFYNSQFHDSIKPVKDSVKGIVELSKLPNSELHIITSRPLEIKEKTQKFLQNHFPDLFFPINYTNEFHNKIDKNKAEICKELGIDLYIEDCLDYAKSCNEKRIKVLLFDRPWNQTNEFLPNITRVYNWQEILDKIKGGYNVICTRN